jgi:phytoene desaturase
MARAGYRTILLEKNQKVGGRAQFAEDAGFKFSLGPNWYTMPDIYEDFFRDFGQSPEDHYTLTKLNPAFRSFTPTGKLDAIELPRLAEQLDTSTPGEGLGLKRLINRSKVIYSKYKLSLMSASFNGPKSLVNPKILLSVLTSPQKTAGVRSDKLLRSPEARALINQANTLFGVPASSLPATYSFLPYSIFEQGVWYPSGGFGSVISAFKSLAQQLGVEIYEGYQVEKIEVTYGVASAVTIHGIGERIPADVIISASDYQSTENMLADSYQSYSLKYWALKKYSPSSIVASLGLNSPVPDLLHHNTFSFNQNGAPADLLNLSSWPTQADTFHVACPSLTDPSLAPAGGSILTITIPIPAGLPPEQEAVDNLVAQATEQIKAVTGFDIWQHIVSKHNISSGYYKDMFNSPGGSATGIALIKGQIFQNRPRLKSKRLGNLFFAGQDVNPGPGAPFAIVSGKLAAYAALGKKPEARL